MFTVVGDFKFNQKAEIKTVLKVLDIAKFVVEKYKTDFDDRLAQENIGKIASLEVAKEKWNQTSVYVFASVLHSTSGTWALAMFDAGVRAQGYLTQFDFDEPVILTMANSGADIRSLIDPFELAEIAFAKKWDPMWCPFMGPARRLWWSGYRLPLFQNRVNDDREAVYTRQLVRTETLQSLLEYELS